MGLLVPLLAFTTIFLAVLVWAAAVLWLRPPIASPQPNPTPTPSVPVPDLVPVATPSSTVPFDPTTAHAMWQQDVAQQVGTLTPQSTPSQIRAVEQQLLGERVTADDRDADLQLMLTLMAFEKGQSGSYVDVQHALAVTQH